ncbi:hypothetical protein GCM10007925_09530 [Sphingomonas astaxanthinifaciens DSM 22298]|uniref:Uncharacterized protein n=1 Tax=Sphingomonas astaxanthinifaciens DSM 22298 TaxID=1123267 RepID=A0ABQ5Z9H6_9SPHN|nr:hypothetical protein GCM10007925_09530 [Sphingomonas astaxanthinifaciens DSM 22298]
MKGSSRALSGLIAPNCARAAAGSQTRSDVGVDSAPGLAAQAASAKAEKAAAILIIAPQRKGPEDCSPGPSRVGRTKRT